MDLGRRKFLMFMGTVGVELVLPSFANSREIPRHYVDRKLRYSFDRPDDWFYFPLDRFKLVEIRDEDPDFASIQSELIEGPEDEPVLIVASPSLSRLGSLTHIQVLVERDIDYRYPFEELVNLAAQSLGIAYNNNALVDDVVCYKINDIDAAAFSHTCTMNHGSTQYPIRLEYLIVRNTDVELTFAFQSLSDETSSNFRPWTNFKESLHVW